MHPRAPGLPPRALDQAAMEARRCRCAPGVRRHLGAAARVGHPLRVPLWRPLRGRPRRPRRAFAVVAAAVAALAAAPAAASTAPDLPFPAPAAAAIANGVARAVSRLCALQCSFMATAGPTAGQCASPKHSSAMQLGASSVQRCLRRSVDEAGAGPLRGRTLRADSCTGLLSESALGSPYGVKDPCGEEEGSSPLSGDVAASATLYRNSLAGSVAAVTGFGAEELAVAAVSSLRLGICLDDACSVPPYGNRCAIKPRYRGFSTGEPGSGRVLGGSWGPYSARWLLGCLHEF